MPSRIGPFAAAVLLLLSPALALADGVVDPQTSTDITGTAAGKQAASDAVKRWADLGVNTLASDVVVLDFGVSGLIVAPRLQTGLSAGVDRRADGSLTTFGDTSAAPSRTASTSFASSGTATTGASAASDASASAVPTWGFWSGSCFSRLNTSAGWMDTCTHFYKLFNDVDSGYDYWDLHLFSIAYA
jgi:hypothetical protein